MVTQRVADPRASALARAVPWLQLADALVAVACGATARQPQSDADRGGNGATGAATSVPDASPGDSAGDTPTTSCAPPGPSLARDVIPALQRRCAPCHLTTGRSPALPPSTVPWLGLPAALTATPQEVDDIRASMLVESTTNPGWWAVVPGRPEVSTLLAVFVVSATHNPASGCTVDVCGINHFAVNGAPTQEEVALLQDWIAMGAPSDSCTVPPPSTSPLLRVPVSLHAGRSQIELPLVPTYLEGLNDIARPAGICFEVTAIASEQRVPGQVDAWLGAIPISGSSDVPQASVTTPSDTATSLAKALLGVQSDVLSQRDIIDVRAHVMDDALVDDTRQECSAPRILEQALCGGATCDPLDLSELAIVLPPCCVTDVGTVDGGVVGACGIEDHRMQERLPGWRPRGCVTSEGLVAPNDPNLAAPPDTTCPTLSTGDAPLIGTVSLPGCCLLGTCGVSGQNLPAALESWPCMNAAAVAERIGSLAPEVVQQVGTQSCTVPGSDPRCPNGAFGPMTLFGCCTSGNQCGVLMGGVCIMPPGTTPLACDAAMP